MTKSANQDTFIKSNAIQLLRSFSKEEKVEFGKFVHSPFNPRSEVARFFDELKKYFPLFERKDFSKENIFAKLYPGKKYKDDVIRKLSSNLFKLGEDYIAYKMFRKDEFEQKKSILNYYSFKDDDVMFWKQADKIKAYMDEQKLRNAEYYYNLKQLEIIKAYHAARRDVTRKKFDNTSERLGLTWQYSVINLLSTYDAALNDMQYFNKKYDVGMLKPLLKIYENPAFIRTEASETHYYSLKLNSDGRNDETFYKIKDLLEKNSYIFNKGELIGFYTSLHNYLFEKSLLPDTDVTKLDFEIVMQMLDLGLLTDKETISAEWFVNVFLKAIRAGEIRYAGEFVEGYKEMLSPGERDNLVTYAYAELEMTKNNFDKALQFMAKTKFNNVWEKLRAYHMYVKIHFEKNDSESFYYTIDSFKHLLKNEPSVNEYVKNLYENFLKYSAILLKIKNGEDDTPILDLKKRMEKEDIIGNRWLFAKLEELNIK